MILVFLPGTAMMHRTAAGRPRAERVRQSRWRDPPVLDFASHVPTEAAAAALADTPGRAVTSVMVPEFGGLAHLPDDPGELTSYGI